VRIIFETVPLHLIITLRTQNRRSHKRSYTPHFPDSRTCCDLACCHYWFSGLSSLPFSPKVHCSTLCTPRFTQAATTWYRLGSTKFYQNYTPSRWCGLWMLALIFAWVRGLTSAWDWANHHLATDWHLAGYVIETNAFCLWAEYSFSKIPRLWSYQVTPMGHSKYGLKRKWHNMLTSWVTIISCRKPS
jgi:hypothetical protein